MALAECDAVNRDDVLLAEFDEAKSLSLIDVVGLENRLSDLLGVKVDLVQPKSLKPRVRSNAEREAVLAFWRSGSVLSGHSRQYRTD